MSPNGEDNYKYEQTFIRNVPAKYLFSSENIEKIRVGKNVRTYHRSKVKCFISERYNKGVFCFERMEDKLES